MKNVQNFITIKEKSTTIVMRFSWWAWQDFEHSFLVSKNPRFLVFSSTGNFRFPTPSQFES